MNYPFLTAAEAASIIRHGDTVGIGGFSSVGTPKAIPAALAERAGYFMSRAILSRWD